MKKNKPGRIKLLLVDDHPIVLDGIKSHLCAQPDFEVVGDAANGQEALRKAKLTLPDVILMDINMPHVNGLEAMASLRRQVPKAKILILTMHDSREYIAQVVRSGARGYLLKDSAPAELVGAIKAVHRGEVYFSPSVSKRQDRLRPKSPDRAGVFHKKAAGLTSREMEVLQLIAEGKANKETAAELGIGAKTVEKHREHLMQKLDIHDTAGLTRYAIETGIIESSVQVTIVEQ